MSSSSSSSSSRPSNPNILVLEDNETQIKKWKVIIMRGLPKVEVEHAIDVDKATQIIENRLANMKELPHLILSDCDLGVDEEDGPSFLKRVKEDKRLRNIPVVMMSSDMGKKREKELMDAGAYEAVEKPLKVETVQKWNKFFP